MSEGRLHGRLAIVTGGVGGRRLPVFLEEGASDIVRKQDALDAVAEEFAESYGDRVVPMALHMGHLDSIGPWVNRVTTGGVYLIS